MTVVRPRDPHPTCAVTKTRTTVATDKTAVTRTNIQVARDSAVADARSLLCASGRHRPAEGASLGCDDQRMSDRADARARVAFDAVVPVNYGTLFVLGDGQTPEDWDECFVAQRNLLLGAAHPGILCVRVDQDAFDVRVTVEFWSGPPALADAASDIVEACFPAQTAPLALTPWDGSNEGADLGVLAEDSRVRLSLILDDGEGKGELLPDRCLLQFWPAPSQPDAVLRDGVQGERQRQQHDADVAVPPFPVEGGGDPVEEVIPTHVPYTFDGLVDVPDLWGAQYHVQGHLESLSIEWYFGGGWEDDNLKWLVLRIAASTGSVLRVPEASPPPDLAAVAPVRDRGAFTLRWTAEDMQVELRSPKRRTLLDWAARLRPGPYELPSLRAHRPWPATYSLARVSYYGGKENWGIWPGSADGRGFAVIIDPFLPADLEPVRSALTIADPYNGDPSAAPLRRLESRGDQDPDETLFADKDRPTVVRFGRSARLLARALGWGGPLPDTDESHTARVFELVRDVADAFDL